MPAAGLIRWGDQSLRAGPWRAGSPIAFLMPASDSPAPSSEFVTRCIKFLAKQGYERVITGALGPEEQAGFLEAGFKVHEKLHLLVLDMSVALPSLPPGPPLRRAWWWRLPGVIEVDAAAFSPFWRLDRTGLREALAATPLRRFKVALGRRGSVLGYAICGAAGRRGFVQRLAVAPEARGRGVGKRLLIDGLLWLRAVGTYQVAVNTQLGNEVALRLYRSLGFKEDPRGLCVLSADLGQVRAA